MEFGEIVLHPAEAETVRWIYDHYLAGASYNALVDKLRERGIPYDGDKPWNKNMAARILADRRYTGEGGFPDVYKRQVYGEAPGAAGYYRLGPGQRSAGGYLHKGQD